MSDSRQEDRDFNLWSDFKRAESYTKYRPHYQETVIPWLLDYHRRRNPVETSKIPLAIDVACGGGQLTGQLAKACDRVIGVDIAPAMLDAAQRHNNHQNIDYRLGSAQEVARVCEGEKADIITVGMAITFFDNEAFYSQVKEVLKENGVLGIFGYTTLGVDIVGFEHSLIQFLEDQLNDPMLLNIYRSLMNSYQDIYLPFKDIERRTLRLHYPTNKEGIEGMFMCNPGIFKDNEKGIKDMVEKLPEDSFNLIYQVCGIMTHL